ncbi:P-loop containing nucleoside triphosphate hydrolase protein [Auriscalpium vulgare]|uniref:P-loop containing nucleoside triphosphate hydrolase protein n=1 Tax=Auriscalpium vulgare TaxID=40419 RepID=A0ACB8S6E8_9AGAM|nr:P-loop containing nucleoside triphosphate hydrolase protein [Auriscalpium vulgare]
MPKKKKTQLKPVARGFATQSVPKKVSVIEKEPEELPEIAEAQVEATAPVTDSGGVSSQAQQTAENDDFDPEKVEEQSLQNLVDKLQDKTEKEIARSLKNLENERRFSKALPLLDIEPEYVDRILELIMESDGSDSKKSVDEPEEKAIARLGITYGVLRRLGFSEDRVDQCLRSIQGVDLEEAYEWMLLYCSEDEMLSDQEGKQGKGPHVPQTPQTPRTPNSAMPHTPGTPSSARPMIQDSSRVKHVSRLDAQAPVFVPQAQLSALLADRDTTYGPTSHLRDEGDRTPSDTDSLDDDPNMEYVRLKMQIDKVTAAPRMPGHASDPAVIQELRARLETIKRHYFFDERDAEAQYRSERSKIQAIDLQVRLRNSESVVAPPKTPTTPPKMPTPPSSVEPAQPSSDIFDSDNEEGAGGLFELLDEMPATESTDTGTTVTVRDMPLPKHGSARGPRIILAEVVHKSDGFAVILYRDVSGSSRAKRAAVTIRWGGGKTAEWVMEDVACHDMTQAEQYISTVALHALTFPRSDGFASASTVTAGSHTFFRLFPPAFRQLWDELEVARKANEDAINRGVWAKLRSIIEPKLSQEDQPLEKIARSAAERPGYLARREPAHHRDNPSEQLLSAFQTRQGSAAYQAMMTERNRLPIASYRDEIISTLDKSQILVLSGETGCGKSTQLPAFILEHNLSHGRDCKIYCTEPRRISAISLAQRVSRELGDAPGAVGTVNSLVGYTVRLESNTSRNTKLVYVTNGIALRMLEGGSGQGGSGLAFDEITHIIIDEVHERSIESDFLLIVLKSLMLERPDLKIVLMSATVDAEKISRYFGDCPVMHVPGRTYPVDIRYLEDAVEVTQWTITETSPFAKRLNEKYYRGKQRAEWTEDTAPAEDDDEEASNGQVKLERRYSASTAATINLLDERIIPYDLVMRLLERICFQDPSYASYSAAILVFMPGIADIRRLNDLLTDHQRFGSPEEFVIHPLHSTVSSESQGAVFDAPPPGIRKIVIATNIAETGITIPDITCVIDSGKHREMRFDEKRQISRLVETFIAKSNAAQRRGRAGRVQNGLCFHLFTKIRHDTQMAEHPDPEIMRLSLSDLALRIKIMKVNLGSSIEDVLARALDPPSSVNIQRAISVLVEVRALTPSEEITPLGRLLSTLPTDVHLGKFLLTATSFRCLDPALTIAATLNSKSPFLTPFGHEDEADRAKSSFRTDNSDFMTLHNAFASWRRASANASFVRQFCRKNFLSHQTMQQIEELRQQFLGYLIDSGLIQVDRAYIRELSRRVSFPLARYNRGKTKFIAVPAELTAQSNNAALVSAALAAGLYPKIISINPSSGQLSTITNNQTVAFHPSSVNFRRKATEFGANHLVYFTLMHSKKLYAWETGPVDDVALALVCGDCDFKARSLLMTDMAFMDRKVKFRVPAKTNLALKQLRTHLATILANQLRRKPLSETQVLWLEMALAILGKVKPESDEKKQTTILEVVVHQ